MMYLHKAPINSATLIRRELNTHQTYVRKLLPLFELQKVQDHKHGTSQMKRLPPFPPQTHTTSILVLFFLFYRKEGKSSSESNSSHSFWKGLIMSNVKIMTCQAQSKKVPSQRTNAELKM